MSQLTEEEFLEITNLHNPKKFSKNIEVMVREFNIRYIDAVIEYCIKHDIDNEIIPKLLTRQLKDKIQVEAMEYNFLPKIGLLPV